MLSLASVWKIFVVGAMRDCEHKAKWIPCLTKPAIMNGNKQSAYVGNLKEVY